jgi:hypothetical protein
LVAVSALSEVRVCTWAWMSARAAHTALAAWSCGVAGAFVAAGVDVDGSSEEEPQPPSATVAATHTQTVRVVMRLMAPKPSSVTGVTHRPVGVMCSGRLWDRIDR